MKFRNLLLLLLLCVQVLTIQAQQTPAANHPKREFRAAWIQAVNGQFRGMPTDKLKQTLINQLNSLPDYPAPANPHLHSIRFMPKGNAGTWRASAVTPVSFWDA